MGPMGLIGPMIARLGLSDAQKDQVRGIMQAHADEFKALATRARAAHQSLEEAIMTDPINDAAIRQSSADVGAIDADMAVAGAHLRAEVFQILTADQQTQAKQMIARRERHGRGQ
jgi:Spy/CpxP family protein refolding chaperone